MSELTSPHNAEAEKNLLACCFLETGREVVDECVAAGLKGEHFYVPRHQIIFDGLCGLAKDGIDPEEVLLASRLQSTGKLDLMGGHAYLYEINGGKIQTTIHAKHWMALVRSSFLRRQIIRTGELAIEGARAAPDAPGAIPELMARIEGSFMDMGAADKSTDAVKVSALMDSFNERLAAQLSRKGHVEGIPTGFTDLDKLTFGMHKKEVTIIAARPNLGKSGIGLNIAQNATIPLSRENRAPTPTLFFSLEMSSDRLVDRLVYSMARVDSQQIRNGFCDRRPEIIEAEGLVRKAPLYFDETPSLTPHEVRARARRQHRKTPLGLIVVDFLQIMSPNDHRATREQQVSEMSANMNAMAKELNLHVLVLCQLNRESEKEKRLPRMSDLRESGAIEQNGDVILLLAPDNEVQDEADSIAVKRVLIVAKNRNGPTGIIPILFNKRIVRFENYAAQCYP